MAMFLCSVGDGIPEVTVPSSSPEGVKILAPSDMYDCQKRRSNHEKKNYHERGHPLQLSRHVFVGAHLSGVALHLLRQ